jgi:hypothetical protein
MTGHKSLSEVARYTGAAERHGVFYEHGLK